MNSADEELKSRNKLHDPVEHRKVLEAWCDWYGDDIDAEESGAEWRLGDYMCNVDKLITNGGKIYRAIFAVSFDDLKLGELGDHWTAHVSDVDEYLDHLYSHYAPKGADIFIAEAILPPYSISNQRVDVAGNPKENEVHIVANQDAISYKIYAYGKGVLGEHLIDIPAANETTLLLGSQDEILPASFVFSDGKHVVFNGAVTLRAVAENAFTIDRVEVDPAHRGQGQLHKILSFMVVEADKHSVSLNASIAPDERNDQLAEAVMRAFNRVGFKPLELDGEIYRKELEYSPMVKENVFNDQFPKASKLAEWALSKAKELAGSQIEYEGEVYNERTKLFKGYIGSRWAPIASEIGVGRVYLVNDEYNQVWIEKRGHYTSDYGKFAVGETRFERVENESHKESVMNDKVTVKNYAELASTPEKHVEFLRVIGSLVDQGKQGVELYSALQKNVSVDDKTFSQARYLTVLEDKSDGWDFDEVKDTVKVEIAQLSEKIKAADSSFDMPHFTTGFEAMTRDLKERGVAVDAGMKFEKEVDAVKPSSNDNNLSM